MKKLLYVALFCGALLAGMTACSPADKAQSEADKFKALIENTKNPDSLRIYIDQAVAYAQKLADEGKLDEARDYMADITTLVTQKAPETTTYFDEAKAKVNAIINNEIDSIKEAKIEEVDSVKEAAKEAAAEKAEEVKEKAAEKVNDAVNTAKEAAKDKVNDAANAAKDKINSIGK